MYVCMYVCKPLGLHRRPYTGLFSTGIRNAKGEIQVYVRHVFLDPLQEYSRPPSVAAGAYRNGSEMTGAGDLVFYIVLVKLVRRGCLFIILFRCFLSHLEEISSASCLSLSSDSLTIRNLH